MSKENKHFRQRSLTCWTNLENNPINSPLSVTQSEAKSLVCIHVCVFIEFKGMNQIIIEKTFAIPETFTTFVVKYDESDFFP